MRSASMAMLFLVVVNSYEREYNGGTFEKTFNLRRCISEVFFRCFLKIHFRRHFCRQRS